ncbi:uncharacterized protein EDB91DRAFT_1250971 [Suillus paluster]|uniref:uncharacterized protein n=1 Tax=Suillus paluster TaxID=48578 RepID=UPI001B87DE2E|nr:uncharacterized protein EDB91DRAFT_1250971 [Suillus paluster]KAG1734448.1 hypothetical protein EDB91DRAFT_1250971 [Suillus paluster]
MAWTFAGLLSVFGFNGAFIIVDQQSRGQPMFHVIPCTILKGMETQEEGPHLQSVLMVSEQLYGTTAIANNLVDLIAHDWAVHTIYTKNVELAERIT